MTVSSATSREAELLFRATLGVSIVGIFFGIFSLFINSDLAIRIAALFLVGIVGILSFLRHSVYFRSDQARMGWSQEHPEFQMEVGFANLAIGVWAIAVSALNFGASACGLMLAVYGTYLLCALVLHVYEALSKDTVVPEVRQRMIRSIFSTLLFVIALFAFAIIAFLQTGPIWSVHI
nr:DUF6790 family protein [uncultured Methanoregula sp.]